MIESLYIENFAIIDTLQVDFEQGMSVLTGETGAGKSIIIDAIGQLIGNRTQTSFIKAGMQKAFIEGAFSIHGNKVVALKLESYGFSVEEDTLIVSKSIHIDGKAVIKMNYRTVPLTVLRDIMPHIVDIHSQFETHSLFDEKNHLSILDQFIGKKIEAPLKIYQQVFFEYKNKQKEYTKAITEELSDEQLEFYQAQLLEMEEVDIENIDEERLEKEEEQLQNYEKITQRMNNYQGYMNDTQGVLPALHLAIKELEYLNDYEEYQEVYTKLYDIYYTIMDTHEIVMDTFRNADFDEFRLQEIQSTLMRLQRLKKKYGASVALIREAKQSLENKIRAFQNRDAYIQELQLQKEQLQKQCHEQALKIHEIRVEAAEKFSKKVEKELRKLYLPNTLFEIQITQVEENKQGQDKVVFMISTNASQVLQPLQKIASGGELSRIMLAIKSMLLDTNGISTIIFDEADTGVSGKVAEGMGIKMKEISKNKQVLCITHLAQVAALASTHYHISKNNKKDIVTVKIKQLQVEESIQELAKMISGKEVSKESLEHAKKLKSKK